MPLSFHLRNLIFFVILVSLMMAGPVSAEPGQLFDDTYLLVSGETTFGMERRQTTIENGEQLRIKTDLIQLTRLYGEIETTEVNIDSAASLDHTPISYREISRSSQYAYELTCNFSNNLASFNFFENSRLVKSHEVRTIPGDRIILPESLPAFLVERLHQPGDSTEIKLLLPASMELSTCAVFFLNHETTIIHNDTMEVRDFRVVCEAGDLWLLRVAGNGRLLTRQDEQSSIRRTLEIDGLDGNIIPLGAEFESFIEGEGVRIEDPRHVNYTLYRLTLPANLAEQFSCDEVYQKCLARDSLGQVEEWLIATRTTPVPASATALRGNDVTLWLASTARIRPGSDPIISLAGQLTRTSQNAAEKIKAILTHIHRNLANDPSAGLRDVIQILESGRANVQERNLLFAALARSIGIPVRLAVGARFDGMVFEKSWFCEVALDSGWYQVDPSRGTDRSSPLLFKYFHGRSFEELDEIYMRLSPALDLAILDWRPRPQFSPQQAWRGMKNHEFIDDEYGLTIPVPEDFSPDWTPQPEPLKVEFKSQTDPGLSIAFMIQEGYDSEARLVDYAVRRETELRALNPSLVISEEPVAGRAGYTLARDDNQLRKVEMILRNGDLLLTIRVEGPIPVVEARWPEILASFLSFRL